MQLTCKNMGDYFQYVLICKAMSDKEEFTKKLIKNVEEVLEKIKKI